MSSCSPFHVSTGLPFGLRSQPTIFVIFISTPNSPTYIQNISWPDKRLPAVYKGLQCVGLVHTLNTKHNVTSDHSMRSTATTTTLASNFNVIFRQSPFLGRKWYWHNPHNLHAAAPLRWLCLSALLWHRPDRNSQCHSVLQQTVWFLICLIGFKECKTFQGSHVGIHTPRYVLAWKYCLIVRISCPVSAWAKNVWLITFVQSWLHNLFATPCWGTLQNTTQYLAAQTVRVSTLLWTAVSSFGSTTLLIFNKNRNEKKQMLKI